MKVKYIGEKYLGRAFEKDKVYEVISIEKDWYRIMTELDDDYLFPPEIFDIVDNSGKEELEKADKAEEWKKKKNSH